MRCPTCGADNPEQARFCMACGAALGPAQPEERRTVSILFADLVGFTERSDAADPEDVRRTLVPFHERAKAAIERFGGTLDKFIGDAAMGVFGAPVSHEDDPERAVRAALDLLEASTGDHPIRVAVNTGEAVVTMGTGPQVGEAVAGDVVNTASRMQSAAPPGGLVIGELTWTAVRDRFETERLPPFVAKGKAEPIAIWRVLEEREVAAGPTTPLVGRAEELALIEGVIASAADRSEPSLVTVVAEPGIGKTRLLREARIRLGERVTWLAGTCPPYGEARALAPLADVVRDLADVGQAQDPEVVERALEELVARLEPAVEERTWLCTRLSALLDASSPMRDRQVPLPEVAAATARILSAAGDGAPVVVAIEDLHWSESALRDVLRGIVEEADGPVVILATARPELVDADPAWGDGPRNERLDLTRLTDTETEELVDLLLSASVRRDHPEVLRNVGGNPLFAVEFVRMLSLEGPAADVPVSVQALIGARLDSVGPERRAIVQDAAVLGSRFWPEALEAIGEDPAAVRAALDDLVRRGLLERSDTSMLPELTEYGFEHALIREVAYARLPRLAKARKHAAAGSWLDAHTGEGGDRFAEPIASHFERAVLLALEAGEEDEAMRWCARAGRALFDAGSVALRLDPASALDRFDRALAVMPPDDPLFPDAVAFSALAGRRSGLLDHEEVLRRHLKGVALHSVRGDRVSEARARASAAGQLMALGRPEEARSQLTTAEHLLDDAPEAASELAHVRAWLAEDQMFAGNPGPAAALADQALSSGAATEQVTLMALHIRGDSRIALGDPGGKDDLLEALARAEAAGAVSEIVTSNSYLADHEWQTEGPAVALARLDEGAALADRRGAYSQGTWTKVAALELLFELGRWDELLERAAPLEDDPRMDVSLRIAIRLWTSAVRLRRGQDVGDLAEQLAGARAAEELQVVAPALALAALAAWARGDARAATGFAREYEIETRGKAAMYRSEWAPALARLAVSLDEAVVARDLVEHAEPATPRDALHMDTAAAIAAADRSAWPTLEARWEAYGCPYERGLAAIATEEPEAVARGRAILADLGVPP